MVLQDTMFAKMPLDVMERTFKPKVQGSLLLDELYRDVDFFILMGSLSGPMGNFAQPAYSAANEFMGALIRRRRQQNLVGSIIQPGEIRGVGYLATLDKSIREAMAENLGHQCLSERDLHELFAEGIMAGRPETGRNPEIICGMRPTDPVKHPNAIWYRTPKWWNFITYFLQTNVRTSSGQVAPVEVQLETATTLPEAAEIIAGNFMMKLRSKLNLPEDAPLTGKTALNELGVDSLVAVDLRIWFVKELKVDIPVLQLLGNTAISQLAQDAATKLDASLIPNVERP